MKFPSVWIGLSYSWKWLGRNYQRTHFFIWQQKYFTSLKKLQFRRFGTLGPRYRAIYKISVKIINFTISVYTLRPFPVKFVSVTRTRIHIKATLLFQYSFSKEKSYYRNFLFLIITPTSHQTSTKKPIILLKFASLVDEIIDEYRCVIQRNILTVSKIPSPLSLLSNVWVFRVNFDIWSIIRWRLQLLLFSSLSPRHNCNHRAR
jgi:hypothetical protein